MPTWLAKNAEVLVTMDGQRRESKGARIYDRNCSIKQIGTNEEIGCGKEVNFVPPWRAGLHALVEELRGVAKRLRLFGRSPDPSEANDTAGVSLCTSSEQPAPTINKLRKHK